MLCLRAILLFTLHTFLNAIIRCLQLNTERGADANRKVNYYHRCSWMAVGVYCCSAQLNRIVIVLLAWALFYQLPICNLFTQHVIYQLWRDTSSELWTLVLFSTLINYSQQLCLLSAITVNPLFSANRLDWQSHWRWGKVFGCVVCRFHVVADAGSAPCQ